MDSPSRREGPALPPTRPTMGMTHPELGSRGIKIVNSITTIMEEIGRNYPMELHELPDLLAEVVDFIEDALSARSPNDSIASDTEQIKARLRAIEVKLDRKITSPALSAATTVVGEHPTAKTWASIAAAATVEARPLPPSKEEMALYQIKIDENGKFQTTLSFTQRASPSPSQT